jgi:hypothetical protein
VKPSEEDGERKCEGRGGGGGKLVEESAEEEESVAAGASSCVRFVLCLAVPH